MLSLITQKLSAFNAPLSKKLTLPDSAATLASFMNRRLIALAFIAALASNVIAEVTPRTEGDGACSANCCQAAQHCGSKLGTRVSCQINCGQPTGAPSQSTTGSMATSRQEQPAIYLLFKSDRVDMPGRFSGLHSQTRRSNSTTPIYIETATLLI